ncbi:MAG TPA: phosphoribosyltransferase family protein [Flavobacteriaceae bacterium]|nr:phosphoribosyltransferase family protein [Flavobacteriaceae bacterium]
MLQEVFNIFFPRICAACELTLVRNEFVVCTHCLHRLPVIPQADAEELVKEYFYGRIPVSQAAALLYFHKKGLTQHLIHRLKYRGDERISAFLGNWLGGYLADLKWTKNIDFIIPVPLHKNRKRKRGYNQVTGFGKSLAQFCESEYTEDILIKAFNSRTQVFKDRFARTELKGAYFKLKNPERIRNKHVLLVDDIITTGATMETCAKVLLKANPAKISLATMAITV